MKKILITGISGFAGSFLAEHLASFHDYDISGTVHSDTHSNNLSEVQDTLQLAKLNLVDREAVDTYIRTLRPDYIYHLAAISSVGGSFANPLESINNNIAAQVNLLEAVRKAELFDAKVLIVSSADIYGMVREEDLPIDEVTPLRPISPYAISKVAQDFIGLQYSLAYNMKIIRVRPFNHIGPRQSPQFVIASFAKKIAEIEKKKIEPILTVGNLEARRDFTDVRDMVKVYRLLLEQGEIGEVYNAGSGTSHKIGEILDSMLSFAQGPITVKVDESLLRPSDIPELRCDNTRLRNLTGWQPTISLEQTLRDTLDYWRKVV